MQALKNIIVEIEKHEFIYACDPEIARIVKYISEVEQRINSLPPHLMDVLRNYLAFCKRFNLRVFNTLEQVFNELDSYMIIHIRDLGIFISVKTEEEHKNLSINEPDFYWRLNLEEPIYQYEIKFSSSAHRPIFVMHASNKIENIEKWLKNHFRCEIHKFNKDNKLLYEIQQLFPDISSCVEEINKFLRIYSDIVVCREEMTQEYLYTQNNKRIAYTEVPTLRNIKPTTLHVDVVYNITIINGGTNTLHIGTNTQPQFVGENMIRDWIANNPPSPEIRCEDYRDRCMAALKHVRATDFGRVIRQTHHVFRTGGRRVWVKNIN